MESTQNNKRMANVCVIDDDTDIVHFIINEIKINTNVSLYSWSSKGGKVGFLSFLSMNKFDLFILDINLPGINGFEVGNKIREFYKKEVPIIYISADTTIREFIGKDQRNTYFIPKPFHRNEILDVVKGMNKVAV